MIHIDFANLEEMMAFSRQLLGLAEAGRLPDAPAGGCAL